MVVALSVSDEGEPQPYSSDLEYLEDNFQLIETLGKALKVEDDHDNTVLFRSDQRKPEAVVRELKAKSRSLKAKISQRVEATRRLGGEWKEVVRLHAGRVGSREIQNGRDKSSCGVGSWAHLAELNVKGFVELESS